MISETYVCSRENVPVEWQTPGETKATESFKVICAHKYGY